MQQLADGTIIAQTTTNGFGQTVVQAQPNTLGGFICTRSEYNARGLLVKSFSDTGLGTEVTAPTHYEYDAMGNVVRQTLALAENPTPENSPITETAYSTESLEDGVYSLITTTRYNAAGQPLTGVQKQLISQLSPVLESKSVFVSERGLTSTQWSEYSENTKRIQYSAVPTSDVTAGAVTVDGFVLSQKDTAGVVSTATCPLAIQKDGTWYTYGWDLTKNICELYGQHGYLRTAYTYTPYGQVTAEGDVEQNIQWSSEFNDTELGLVYYNYRHYNPVDGRWIGRDTLEDTNLLVFVANNPVDYMDILGQRPNIYLLPDKKVTTDGKTEYMLAENCINMSSSFVIVAHGNPHYIIDKNGAELYPGDLTNLMISKGYKFDKPVLLIACETGLGFAQKLANELKKRGESQSVRRTM